MPTVRELSDPYANFLLNPVPPANEDTCSVCLTFTDGYARCYRCDHDRQYADAVLPISYSVHFGQLHTALMAYKRRTDQAGARFRLQLSAVLWRFLEQHESCLAAATEVDGFELVTSVPSGSRDRDALHPLRHMLSDLVRPTVTRYERLLVRSSAEVEERTVDPAKFDVSTELDGESILLIDDTWTTGANVQSAAGALKSAGASTVGVAVIGRHIHAEYSNNESRLRNLPRPFDWDSCALE